MAIEKYEDLNSVQLDVLREIGNIGSGNAATALAQLLNRFVDMQVPEVCLLDFNQAMEVMGEPDKVVAGILIRLQGDIEGMIMFILEEQFARTIVTSLMGEKPFSLLELDEADVSVLSEIGNIMGGSYVNAIANIAEMFIDISVPALTADMLGAIMSVPAVEFSQVGDTVLMINGKFLMDSVEIHSNMLLIPTVDSLSTLLKKLGVEGQ